jgi:hypothetical protein
MNPLFFFVILLLMVFITKADGNDVTSGNYIWDASHMCTKAEYCLKNPIISMSNLKKYRANRNQVCKCKGIYSYECSIEVCSISKTTCEAIHANRLRSSSVLDLINGCI